MPVPGPLRHPLAARRTQRGFHFFMQHHLDDLPHSLSKRCLQPVSQRTLLAHFHCSASLRHGVFLLCPEPLAEIPGLSPSMTLRRIRLLLFYRNRDRTEVDVWNINPYSGISQTFNTFRKHLLKLIGPYIGLNVKEHIGIKTRNRGIPLVCKISVVANMVPMWETNL